MRNQKEKLIKSLKRGHLFTKYSYQMKIETLKKIIKYLPFHKIGKCPICGNTSIFFALETVATARNHMGCMHCWSSSRKRHVAKAIIEHYRLGPTIKGACGSNIRIYNTSSNDVFSSVWKNYVDYYCSDFIPGVAAGTSRGERVSCENLESLSFLNDFFDLVITEDVFEHIRDDTKAFLEIYRVLKPGGTHIFTVPFLFDRPTLTRIDTSSGEDIMLLPPEYHGDPVRGQILAYRTYGIDLFSKLAELGFNTSVVMSQYADLRYGIVNSYLFISTK